MKTNTTNKPDPQNEIKKSVDILVVLHNTSNTIGLVQGVDPNGNLIEVNPKEGLSDPLLTINSDTEAFAGFYAEFYQQLKDPSDFSFFKVTEYEAIETAINLQHYIDHASEEDRLKLKEYEVSTHIMKGNQYLNKHATTISMGVHQDYRYQPEDMDWKMMEKLGLSREKLQKLNAWEPLLKGYKTPMLIPIEIDTANPGNTIEARLSLKLNDQGEMELRFDPVREEPDFSKSFFGHTFSAEDKRSLTQNSNVGRIVNLIHPITGETIPSLISVDRLTRELIPLPLEFVRIPKVIKEITLTEEQHKVLSEGKPLYIENLVSKSGSLFNATVQFNTDKQHIEFLFDQNIKSLSIKENTQVTEIPQTFRGKSLKKWQIEKLNAGEAAYIDGLVDKNGKAYQGYLKFNKNSGLEFSFRNLWKQEEPKRRGRRM